MAIDRWETCQSLCLSLPVNNLVEMMADEAMQQFSVDLIQISSSHYQFSSFPMVTRLKSLKSGHSGAVPKDLVSTSLGTLMCFDQMVACNSAAGLQSFVGTMGSGTRSHLPITCSQMATPRLAWKISRVSSSRSWFSASMMPFLHGKTWFTAMVSLPLLNCFSNSICVVHGQHWICPLVVGITCFVTLNNATSLNPFVLATRCISRTMVDGTFLLWWTASQVPTTVTSWSQRMAISYTVIDIFSSLGFSDSVTSSDLSFFSFFLLHISYMYNNEFFCWLSHFMAVVWSWGGIVLCPLSCMMHVHTMHVNACVAKSR